MCFKLSCVATLFLSGLDWWRCLKAFCPELNHVFKKNIWPIHQPNPNFAVCNATLFCPLLSPSFNNVTTCIFLLCVWAQMDVCVCSDVLLCKLPAVLRCVTALLAVEVRETAEEPPHLHSSPSSPSSSSSLLSTDFLLFYCAAMALLYVLYCYLLS